VIPWFEVSGISRSIFSILLLSLGAIGTITSVLSSNTGQVWAAQFEGTEGPDVVVGTLGDD
jgi:hypothetical protein